MTHVLRAWRIRFVIFLLLLLRQVHSEAGLLFFSLFSEGETILKYGLSGQKRTVVSVVPPISSRT
jgi:hypothetical protein